MPTYPAAAWARLGREVKTARRRAGMTDSAIWAEKIGRSTRTLLGLERGEPTGDDTLLRIDEALGWPTGRCIEILEGTRDGPSDADPAENAQSSEDDEIVLMHLPRGALAGFGPAEREEALANAKAAWLQTAREIRRQLDS